MDPILGGAIIGGATRLIGNLFGSKNNKDTNDANLKINQMNNEFNAREAEKAFQRESAYNDRIRAEDREYNSAKAQVERFRQAGLNPSIMMQGQGAGVAQSNGVSSGSAQSSGNARMNAFQPDLDLSGTIHSFLSLRQQKEFQDEQINGLRIENQYKAQKIMAEILDLKAKAKSNEARAKLDSTLEGLQGQIVRNQTITAESQARQANESANLARAQEAFERLKMSRYNDIVDKDLAYKLSLVDNLKASTDLTYEQYRKEVYNTIVSEMQAKHMELDYKKARALANEYVDYELWRYSWQPVSDVLGGVNSIGNFARSVQKPKPNNTYHNHNHYTRIYNPK